MRRLALTLALASAVSVWALWRLGCVAAADLRRATGGRW